MSKRGNKDSSDSSNNVSSDEASPESESSRSSVSLSDLLHDLNDDATQTLDDFTRLFCTKDVYQIFNDYTRIIRESTVESHTICKQSYELNRYVDIPCFSNTRVAVKHPTQDHDYIHANYVDGFCEKRKFILTQAPLDATIEQFWKMVWSEKVALIVSLALIDGIRCPAYFPIEAAQSEKHGPYVITHAGTRHIRDAYDATMLMVQKEDQSSVRTILHLAFYCWPDKGTPTSPTEVLNFIADMNHNRNLMTGQAIKDGWLNETESTPILVHCIAGVGRSGSLVVLDICQRKLDASKKELHAPVLNIEDVVYRVRAQRALAVQKPEQFLFINLSMVEYALRKHYYKSLDFLNFSNFMQVEDQ